MLTIEKQELDDAIHLNVEGDKADLIFRINTEANEVTITAWDDFAKINMKMSTDEFIQFVSSLVGLTGPSAWDLSERVRDSSGWFPGWQEDGRWSSKTRECGMELIVDTMTDISTLQIRAPNMRLEAVVVNLLPIKEVEESED